MNIFRIKWALDAIKLPDAWDITTGSSSVKVGILDTGIDVGHPDLAGRVSVSDSASFITGEEIPQFTADGYGHGTHVAGIVGAITNNSVGIAGGCNVTLVSLKVFDDNGYGYASNLALAIQYAERKSIPILNFSGRWYSGSEYYDYALGEVIDSYSGLFVCAAGNESRNNDTVNIYPANDRYLNTITVGASTSKNQRWWNLFNGSNYGVNSVDIFAPGDEIISCYPTALCEKHSCDTPGYHSMSGTSMATPYVTAVAALMLSENPSLTPVQIRIWLLANCDQYDALSNYCATGGVVNAYKAVLNSYWPMTASVGAATTVAMSQDAHRWFKMTITTTGYYVFTTEGDLNTTGELFDSESGLLYIDDDDYEADDGADVDYNFYIGKQLEEGDVVYLRITAGDSSCQGACTLIIRYYPTT